MRRPTRSLAPSVDVMEPRTLLSSGVPLLSGRALRNVVHDVRSIMSTLARTGNTVRAGAELTSLSSRIPSGTEELAPTWRSDLERYRPHSPGSASATETLVLADLYGYVRGGGGSPVTAPTPPPQPQGTQDTGNTVGASGTEATGTPAPAQSLDSVTIQNSTGMNLVVTVYLRVPQVQQPWITETIPAGSTIVDFNFGSSTGAFMTMNVSLADGGQSPPPFSNVALDQPIGGYDGTLFTISLFGPYFNVTPG
jgi:hypothetical protein